MPGKKSTTSSRRIKRIKNIASKSVKMIIAASRSLIAAISSIGVVAIIIILIVCMIGFISMSAMGVFFSNDSGDTKMVDVVSKLNVEFFDKVERIKTKNKYDDYVLTSTDGSNSINWNEVLAVYAVSTVTDPKDAMEVVSVDNIKEKKLRKILYDMNKIRYKVTKAKEIEGGKTYTVKILTVTIEKISAMQIAKGYKFSKEQVEMLTEILKPTYDELWASLIYGSGGSGEIIVGVGNGQLAWPVPGCTNNTSNFGMRKHPITGRWKMHNGIDLAAPTGTKIVAAEAGKITFAGWNGGGYGNFTEIDHGNALFTRYAHQSRVIAKSGQAVKRGQVIGLIGSTGASTGPHLHFEVRINGKFDDPLKYIKSK